MGPDGRSGARDFPAACASLEDLALTAVLDTTAAGKVWAMDVFWVTDAGRVMAVEIGAPVLQPATATTDASKKDNLMVRARIRNSSRANGHTGSTCPSRIQPYLDQHGRRSDDKERIKWRIHHLV